MAAAAAEAGKGSPTPAGDTTITGDEGKGGAAADEKAGGEKAGEKKGDEGKTPDQKAADQKAADDKAAADKKALEDQTRKDGQAPPESKAPAKYELSVPEAADGFIDDSDISLIEKVAKEQGWTNDQAQAALEQHADTLAQNSARYRAETEADPVLGGDNLAETTRLARAGLEFLAPSNTDDGKALRRVLAKSGMGNNRLVVGALRKLGLATAEDQPLGGGQASKGDKPDTATVLYGKDGGVKQ